MYELEIPYGESDEYLAVVSYWVRFAYAAGGRPGTRDWGYSLEKLKPNYNYDDLKSENPNHLNCKEFYERNMKELDKYFGDKVWEVAQEVSPYED